MKRDIKTLGDLKKSGYKSKTIKDELRDNLIKKIQLKEPVFIGIVGFEDTVIPEVERAILSRHNINLLGLRGQAKTRIARQMTEFLDEYMPIIEGSELNDDPLNPISSFGKEMIAMHGDSTPIAWMHRSERYVEKLATPDVSIADLIGDVDPIKAANLKLSYSDERVIHYGIIPRSNRCIFVINELPDLQARIQVSLFNILQEGDIQIRGFKLRLMLDIQFVFTANPEDYTNRGSIVTPLKDRIGSQILTHYPKSIEVSKLITSQEAKINKAQKDTVEVGDLVATLIERIAFEARESEYVDSKSGVSARLTISAYENLVSTAERRMLMNGETKTHARISDLSGVVSAVNGKIELVYEGEQEGAGIVALSLLSKAIRNQFVELFPDPGKLKKKKEVSPYQSIVEWFSAGNEIDLLLLDTDANYKKILKAIPGLDNLVENFMPKLKPDTKHVMMEFVLFGLAEHSLIGKNSLVKGIQFKDLFGSMFSNSNMFDEEL
ncbi:MAG TPA: magnesium chelatase [Chitinophagaceae bacterium]|nr:magnesium chelatase [Chitinophagaceae bacterium]